MASYPWSTKIQAYLAKIAGKEVENLPEPTTKEQQLLKEIAESGGSGSSGGGLVVHMDAQTNTLDTTWQEINNAMAGGTPVMICTVITELEEMVPLVFQVVSSGPVRIGGEDAYQVEVLTDGHSMSLVSYSPTDYPSERTD